MESRKTEEETIYRELASTDSEVRADYLKHFEPDARAFSEAMAQAVLAWKEFDNGIKSQERAYVSALIHAAITLHIISLKLFLSGHMVAAGNLFRQVIESIALSLLCSSKDLTVLTRFMEDKYSSSIAVSDVIRHWRKLGLLEGSVQQFKDGQAFYHKYSHITRLTLANLISFSETAAYVGAAFDEGKIDAYKKEMNARVSLAEVFPNFIAAVQANVVKW